MAGRKAGPQAHVERSGCRHSGEKSFFFVRSPTTPVFASCTIPLSHFLSAQDLSGIYNDISMMPRSCQERERAYKPPPDTPGQRKKRRKEKNRLQPIYAQLSGGCDIVELLTSVNSSHIFRIFVTAVIAEWFGLVWVSENFHIVLRKDTARNEMVRVSASKEGIYVTMQRMQNDGSDELMMTMMMMLPLHVYCPRPV